MYIKIFIQIWLRIPFVNTTSLAAMCQYARMDVALLVGYKVMKFRAYLELLQAMQIKITQNDNYVM